MSPVVIREDAVGALAAVPGKYATPDPSIVSTIPKGGVQLAYVGHAEITLALIDVDPCWTWEPVALDEHTGGPIIGKQGNRLVMWGYLEVLGVRRLCVGTCLENKGDPEKELIGDLLRNGAMRFGIGTKLWSKADSADPAGSGGTGGYQRAEPTFSARATAAFNACKAVTADKRAALTTLAQQNNKKLTVAAFDADERWLELVEAEIAGEG